MLKDALDLMKNEILGDLVVSTYNAECGEVVCIYGNPEGLRNLASQLIALADLDQDLESDNRLPKGEGVHVHLSGLQMHSSSVNLGRLDAKMTMDYSWYLSQFDDDSSN